MEWRNWARSESPPSWENPVRLPVSRFHDANFTENASSLDGSVATTGPSRVRSTVKLTGDCPATSMVSWMARIGICLPFQSYVGGLAAKLTLCSM